MNYTFLLVNFNMWGLVERCVREIQTHVDAGDRYEILIADNSTDARFRVPDGFERTNENVKVSRLAENRGWVDALNAILPKATGEYVLIMHPDVTFGAGCLTTLRAFLERTPGAAVASPDLVYPDGTPNTIRLQFPRLAVEARRLANIVSYIVFKRRPLRDEMVWDHSQDVAAEMVMSVMMMFRREVLEQIGPVDRRLWTYYANDWLCDRARRLGRTCHYVAAARATHWERHSPTGLYSDAANSAYKRDPVPVSDRMCQDRFVFLRSIYSRPKCVAFRVLVTLEHCVHMLAQLKPGRDRTSGALRKHAATLKAAWV
jgi:N-acetylglucosaminyl-diphospho-decaprenol L-rhamnosyltransferase